MLEPVFQDKLRRWWSREDLLLLILLGALFFLPGLGQMSLFDKDEPRFATAAREMIRSGDYMVPHFNGELRPDKPPLVYWLMDVSYRAAGGFSGLAARLPSAVCGILTLLVVYFMVGLRFGRVTGLLASIMLGSCALFIAESRLATADATMLLFIVTCMACAWQAWDAGQLPRTNYRVDRSTGKSGSSVAAALSPKAPVRMPFYWAMLFWVSLAAGTLTKGVPLFFVLVPMVILSLATGTLAAQIRERRSHVHLTGIRIGIALTVAVVAVAITAGAVPALGDARILAAILGALVVGMVLTPGLPGALLYCVAGGNWGWWKQLRPLIGVPVLLVLVGWWVAIADLQTHGVLIHDMVLVHFVARVANPVLGLFNMQIADPSHAGAGGDAMASYSKPPGFYLCMVWVTFWPWSVLLVPAAYHAVKRLLGRTAIAIDPRPYQFLIAWIVPMWILLELARGKLLHYPLPLYVGIAILCADAVVQSWHRMTDVLAAPWFAVLRWVVLGIWLGMAVVLLIVADRFLDADLFWRCVPLAGAIAAVGVAGAIAWNRPGWPFVTVLGWAFSLLYLNTFVMPEISAFQLGKLVGTQLAELSQADPSCHLAAQGFTEPTLVFYTGRNIEMPYLDSAGKPVSMLDKIPFAPAKAPRTPYLLVVDQARLEQLKDRGVTFYRRRTITSFKIQDFRRVPVSLYIVSNVPMPAPLPIPATSPTQPAIQPLRP